MGDPYAQRIVWMWGEVSLVSILSNRWCLLLVFRRLAGFVLCFETIKMMWWDAEQNKWIINPLLRENHHIRAQHAKKELRRKYFYSLTTNFHSAGLKEARDFMNHSPSTATALLYTFAMVLMNIILLLIAGLD